MNASRPNPADGLPVRVVVGLLRRNGQVLLCHRHPNRTNYPDVWDLPGGHIDADETMAEALVRELVEELGVRIKAPEPFPWEMVHFDGVELNIFIVDRWEGEPWNAAPDEHDELRWVGLGNVPHLDLAHRSYALLLRRALA